MKVTKTTQANTIVDFYTGDVYPQPEREASIA